MVKEINAYTMGKRIIAEHKRSYVLWSLLFAVISGIFIFSLPRTYKSSTQVIPEESDADGLNIPKNLSQLSSIAGVSIGGANGKDAINPDIYPDIFNSTTFLVDILALKVKTNSGREMSYQEYLQLHSPSPWWETAFHHIFKDKPQLPIKAISPTHFTKEQEQLIKTARKSINCEIDKKTGMIDLSTTTNDPVVSATLADAIMQRLQTYIIDYRTGKAKVDLKYAQLLFEESQKTYTQKQKAYVSYSDSHQDPVLSAYSTKLEELENEMQNAFNNMTQLNQQVNAAKAKLQERTPAFTVIQKAAIPVRPSGPKRVFTVALSGFAALFFCFCYHFYREIYA